MTIKIISQGNNAEKPNKKSSAVSARKPTLLQERVIKLTKETLVADGRKAGGGRISKADIIRRAGGSEAVARHPDKVYDSPVVQEALNPVITKMRNIREKVLNALDEKEMSRESAFNLTMIAGMLTKDSELLDGRPTSRDEHELPPEEKARLDKLFKLNS